MNDWPFDQPPDCAVISLSQIVVDGQPILRVTHDEDDHGWQFLSNDKVQMADALVVSLGNVVKRDPTVKEVADLPPGWHACRQAVGEPWIRQKSTVEESE